MIEVPVREIDDLLAAYRILIAEDVLDAFGHLSLRDPIHDDVFWLPRAVAPARVGAQDFRAYNLEGIPLEQADGPHYIERFIHAAFFAARADLRAVCHHHAGAIMPFCLGPAVLRPVSQTGAFMGGPVPVWDAAASFGSTAMRIEDMTQAREFAGELGSGFVVLMRGHGATVGGLNPPDLAFRAVHSVREAEAIHRASMHGSVSFLSEGEIALAAPLAPSIIARCWDHWSALHAHRADVGHGETAS